MVQFRGVLAMDLLRMFFSTDNSSSFHTDIWKNNFSVLVKDY